MYRIFMVGILALALAPWANAQESLIDCSGGCSTIIYGLSDEPVPPGGSTREPGVILKSGGRSRLGRTDNSCAGEEYFSAKGQVVVTEQDNCTVSSTNRCQVEMQDVPESSGIFNQNRADIPFGTDFIGVSAGIFQTFQGNVGVREINGTCVNDGNVDCGLDADCPSGTGCMSSCFSTGELCASDADCANADCITAIDWDFYGRCTDNAGDGTELCSRDGMLTCPEGESCLDGFTVANSVESCVCCNSISGTLCGLFGWVEYPGLVCPNPSPNPLRRDVPDWIFEGGRMSRWTNENILVEGQQEGVCLVNRQRSCGVKGDFWAGSENDKCAFMTCTLDDNELCDSDADCPSGAGCALSCPDPFSDSNPALASGCDDEAFGGMAGDSCDFREQGYRVPEADLLPDARQNPAVCPENIRFMTGLPDRDCQVPADIPEGDPQPGCRLNNFGIGGRPDFNCNQIDDTLEGRCQPDGSALCDSDADCDGSPGSCILNGDLCPFLEETRPFLDSDGDGRGNQCQCGDTIAGDDTTDGFITAIDIGGMAQCANGQLPGPRCDPTLTDSNGDNTQTAIDISAVAQVVNGVLATRDLSCVRDIDGSTP